MCARAGVFLDCGCADTYICVRVYVCMIGGCMRVRKGLGQSAKEWEA